MNNLIVSGERKLPAHVLPELSCDTCPNCSSTNNSVKDSRETKHGRRRRRLCNKCGHKWSTMEIRAQEAIRMLEKIEIFEEKLQQHGLDLDDMINAVEVFATMMQTKVRPSTVTIREAKIEPYFGPTPNPAYDPMQNAKFIDN